MELNFSEYNHPQEHDDKYLADPFSELEFNIQAMKEVSGGEMKVTRSQRHLLMRSLIEAFESLGMTVAYNLKQWAKEEDAFLKKYALAIKEAKPFDDVPY